MALHSADKMDPFMQGLGELLRSGDYSDLEIKCGAETFKVHRAIVCTRSDVLARQCKGGFKEADTRIIHHSTFGPTTLKRLLHFMYTGSYDCTEGEEQQARDAMHIEPLENPYESGWGLIRYERFHSITARVDHRQKSFEELRLQQAECYDTHAIPTVPQGSKERIIAHVYVHAIADYYQVGELRDLAARNFETEIAQLEYITASDFVQIAAAVYENTIPDINSSLRHGLLQMALGHRERFLASKEFLAAISMQPELQQFAAEFLKELDTWHERRHESLHEDVEWSTVAKRTEKA